MGELALAIGNPFGVGQTVSSGIISGLARSGGAGGAGHGYFIQTDAPINPGNSGGALIDMQGNLVGINTSILTRSGGSNGIGFAIPADLVAAFVDQARAGNSGFERPWAGMSGQVVDAEMAETLGLDVPGGIVVSALHPVSPFKTAGFEVGDVITAVDGAAVNTPAEMVYRMSVAGLGQDVSITRWRGDTANDVAVTLMTAPEKPPRDTVLLGDDSGLPGLAVSQINPAVIAEFNLPLLAGGVVVSDAGPVAPRVGLRTGDVILAINGDVIETPPDVRKTLRRSGRGLVFDIQRGTNRAQLRFRR